MTTQLVGQRSIDHFIRKYKELNGLGGSTRALHSTWEKRIFALL